MLIKDYVVTQRHYPGLCPDYEPLTTEISQSRRVIKYSLKIGQNHSRLRKHKGTIRVRNVWNKEGIK